MKTLVRGRPFAATLTLATAFAIPAAAWAPGAGSGLPGSLSAQEPPQPTQDPAREPPDLASLFELGTLVLDTNGDSVPDLVNAALILGDDPSPAVLAAAGEVAARLGFETMAMDLPLSREATGEEVAIVVGRGGLAASGLASPGIDPASLDSGEGAVAVRQEDGRTWVLVVGGDDEGLEAAARLFAGVLPHTRTLSTAALDRVRDDLAAALEDGGVPDPGVRLTQARTRAGQPGVGRVIAEVDVGDDQVEPAAAALRALAAGEDARDEELEPEAEADPAAEADPEAETDPEAEDADDASRTPLAYPGLESVEARLAGGLTIRIAGRAPPDRPGPIAGRPGSGGKNGMDLSNLYTSDGLLGGGLIPDRVDAMLAPGGDGVDGLPDLAGRLGLESTGLVVPLTEPAADIDRPGSRPTLVLAGTDNPLTQQLADSAQVDLDALGAGEGLIEFVPDAFGSKPALVVTGADAAGAERALDQLALTFPHLAERGDDRPTVDDVERELWDALSGHAPVGQAATGLYKLGRIADELAGRQLARAHVLMSVEKADPGLEAYVRGRAADALGLADIGVTIDDRDVQRAATIFADTLTLPSEVDRFRELFRTQVLPAAGSGAPIRVEARLSEPPALRRQLEREAREALIEAGASPSAVEVRVLSAFKQGYSWLEEVILPQLAAEDDSGEGSVTARDIGEVVIRFRRNDPPPEWPQQAIHTPVRWLHEIFPIDEVLSRDLGLDLEQIRFDETTEGPIYEVAVSDADGAEILRDSFEPRWVLRPYFDRFRDYEHVRVTTGWLHAVAEDRTLVDERIVTDPEAFWDHYQSVVLPAVYDYVMERHDGIPNGGSADAPYFGELTVDLAMSEPNYRLEIDNEIHAPMDALHEEVYFGTIEFFDMLGRNSRGQGLTFPGRILPVMRPRADGAAAELRVSFTGFATSRPAVVVAFEDAAGAADTMRLDIPKTGLERPSARRAVVRAGEPGLAHLGLRVRVDTDADVRDSLLTYAPAEQVDRSMVSAEMVEATVREIESLRAAGLYASALSWDGLGSMEVWAEWTHEQDPDARRTARLAANGSPPPLPDWRSLVPEGWSYGGERLVQWETPMPPAEGHEILAKMAHAFDEVSMYKAGESYLGRDIWAADLMPPIAASHWSRVKATTFKPTVINSARQHANEVSSTSHVLRHAELLLTDPEQRRRLDEVNVVIHPFTNPDGAQLAYDLYRITPDFILHAGYLGSLGIDATTGSRDDHPIYPEAPIRNRLWGRWLPDIFLNPHGYPSHQVVQLFSEYTGLVRRGRVTERNWGFNKGWFMPGFGYVDSPDLPRHRDAAFEIRDYITRGINSNRDVFEMNQRNYERYRRYGAAYDPDVFRLPMTDSVLIQMPLKGSSGEARFGFDSRITIWSGTTEAPDETAYGPWMELVAKAGLSWDQAVLDYLYEGEHEVNRSGSSFFGGVSLRMNRPRPPEEASDPEEDESVTTEGPGAGPGPGAGGERAGERAALARASVRKSGWGHFFDVDNQRGHRQPERDLDADIGRGPTAESPRVDRDGRLRNGLRRDGGRRPGRGSPGSGGRSRRHHHAGRVQRGTGHAGRGRVLQHLRRMPLRGGLRGSLHPVLDRRLREGPHRRDCGHDAGGQPGRDAHGAVRRRRRVHVQAQRHAHRRRRTHVGERGRGGDRTRDRSLTPVSTCARHRPGRPLLNEVRPPKRGCSGRISGLLFRAGHGSVRDLQPNRSALPGGTTVMRNVRSSVLFLSLLGLAAAGPWTRSVSAQVPKVTAGQVVDRETLRGFVTYAASVAASITDINQGSQLIQAVRTEGGDYNVGNMYLIFLTTDGQVFIHGEDPNLDGVNVHGVVDDNGDPVVQQILAAGAAGGGFVEWCWDDPLDPNDPRCKDSYALQHFSPVAGVDLVVVGGYYQDLSGAGQPLPPIPLPEVSAADVVDRETLRQFVDGSVVWLRDLIGQVGFERANEWKGVLREEGGHFKSGPIYLFIFTPEGYVIFHGADPWREGRTAIDNTDLQGRPFVREVIAVAQGGGGFVEYFWDDPTVQGDEDTGTPKVSYAVSLRSDLPVFQGVEFIVGAGFYRNFSTAEAEMAAADWLERFGRSVASQAMEMIGDRVAHSHRGPDRVTLGGRTIDFASLNAQGGLFGGLNALAPAAAGYGNVGSAGAGLVAPTAFLPASMGGLIGETSFQLSPGQDAGGGRNYSLWGAGEMMRFSGGGGEGFHDGEIVTGALGADYAFGSLLAGLAVSHSRGSGGFELGRAGGDDVGDVTTSLTSAFPYARLAVSDRLSVWGVAGYGFGQLDISGGGEQDPTSDITMRMAGVGVHGELVGADDAGDFELAVRSDGFLAQMNSDEVEGRSELTADVSRVRLMLETSKGYSLAGGEMVQPHARVGMRRDGGDVETGLGMEVGGGLTFLDPETGLTISVHGRTLVTHEQSDYDEWGLGGSIRLNPRGGGRGLSLGVSPSWGSTASGLARLWAQGATGMTRNSYGYGLGGRRLDAELGYGVDALAGRGVFTPYARLVVSEQPGPGHVGAGHVPGPVALMPFHDPGQGLYGYHVGGRLSVGPGLALNLETGRSAYGAASGPGNSVMLNLSMNW